MNELVAEKVLDAIDDLTIVAFIVGAVAWVYSKTVLLFAPDDVFTLHVGAFGVVVALFAAFGNLVVGMCYDRFITAKERVKR